MRKNGVGHPALGEPLGGKVKFNLNLVEQAAPEEHCPLDTMLFALDPLALASVMGCSGLPVEGIFVKFRKEQAALIA